MRSILDGDSTPVIQNTNDEERTSTSAAEVQNEDESAGKTVYATVQVHTCS